MIPEANNAVSYALGTGRCGTKFLYKLLDLEPNVSSVHERNSLNETFHRYCKWYGVDIDNEGFLHTKEKEIQADLAKSDFSFESSAYLSLSVEELYQRFNAKFILLVRAPEKVVNSYLRKGWYDKPFIRANADLPPSYQESKRFHHFLGRLAPSGDAFNNWQKMSRVGKLGWYWNALNAKVLEQFKNIPEDHWRIEKLEEFSYEQHFKIAEFLGIRVTVPREQFQNLVFSRPNAAPNVPSFTSWGQSEIEEFEQQVLPMAKYFGYEHRIDRILRSSSEQRFSSREDIDDLSSSSGALSKAVTSLRKFFG